MQGRTRPRPGAFSGVLCGVLLMGSTSTGGDARTVIVLELVATFLLLPFLPAALTAPTCPVNGLFLDAEFGPAFLLFLLWVTIASMVPTLRAGGAGVKASANHRAARPQPALTLRGRASCRVAS